MLLNSEERKANEVLFFPAGMDLDPGLCEGHLAYSRFVKDLLRSGSMKVVTSC